MGYTGKDISGTAVREDILEDLFKKKKKMIGKGRKHLGEDHSRKREHSKCKDPKEAKDLKTSRGRNGQHALSRVSELRENEEMPSEK